MKLLTLLLTCLLSISIPTPAIAAGPNPTPDELHQMLTDGQYQPLLQKISRILSLTDQAQAAYDKYDLLMLRGEAQLHLKAGLAASDTFGKAAAAASKPEDQQAARALELLARRSPRGQYTPSPALQAGRSATQPAGAIDIIDPISRKKAFAAYFSDKLAADKPKIAAAAKQSVLPPMLDVAPLIQDLRVLEIASDGDGSQTRDAVGDLPKHAQSLMNDVLARYAGRVSDMETTANQRVDMSVNNMGGGGIGANAAPVGKTGLNLLQQRELKEIIDDCTKIGQAAADLRAALGSDETVGLATTTDQADRIVKQATDVLTADYRH